MRVIRGLSTNKEHPLTSPFPLTNGVFIELRGGNICDPVFGGNWFSEPYPKHVLRFFCPWAILPFISWRFGNRGGYIGLKAYGADPEAYLNWMPKEDVYEGSQALCFSARPFATITK